MNKVLIYVVLFLLINGCDFWHASFYKIQYHQSIKNIEKNHITSKEDIMDIIETILNEAGLKKQTGVNGEIIYSGRSEEKDRERRVKVEIEFNANNHYLTIKCFDVSPGKKSELLENIDRELNKNLREKGISMELVTE